MPALPLSVAPMFRSQLRSGQTQQLIAAALGEIREGLVAGEDKRVHRLHAMVKDCSIGGIVTPFSATTVTLQKLPGEEGSPGDDT